MTQAPKRLTSAQEMENERLGRGGARKRLPGTNSPLLACRLVNGLVPYGVESSPREKGFFHLFRTQSINNMSGCWDEDFWKVTVLASIPSSKAIWHAVLSITALFERSKITGGTEIAICFKQRYYDFALSEYSKSVSYLLSAMKKQRPSYCDKETLLIATSIFVGICTLQGDLASAMVHIRSGLRLFYEWRFWEDVKHCGSRRQFSLPTSNPLTSLFVCFTAQHVSTGAPSPWSGQGLPELIGAPFHSLEELRLFRSVPFRSVEEAYMELRSIFVYASAQRRQQNVEEWPRPGPPPSILHMYRLTFRSWHEKYSKAKALLWKECTNLRQLLNLQLMEVTVRIMLSHNPSGHYQSKDGIQVLFAKAISLGEQILTMEGDIVGSGMHNFESPVFSILPAAFAQLGQVAMLCRDPALRLQATSLLRAWPRQATRLPDLTCQIVEARWNLEVSGALRSPCDPKGGQCIPGSYVCVSHRVCDVQLLFTGQRQARLEIKTVGNTMRNCQGEIFNMGW